MTSNTRGLVTRLGGLAGTGDRRGQTAESSAVGRASFAAEFGELYYEPDPAGRRRFVWKVPAHWPVAEEAFEAGRVGDQDAFWLHVAIWACLPQWRPASLEVADSQGRLQSERAAPFIYKTDAERSRKARVHFQPLGEPEGTERFLTLAPRRSGGPLVCRSCHPSLFAFVPASAARCAGCGTTVDELKDFTERLYAQIRKAAGVR